ncbi:MAG: zinc-dependent alcohol dehydrogenase family protein [Anaerolineae bacterium]|nr:zinc-dependent alcohol dehydrogenase family protein [Anaerolineae bacterium]
MRAAVVYGPGDLRIIEREVPRVGAGDLLMRVAACGICGTDRHIFHGDFDAHPPVILGHEYAGEVVAVGRAVTDLAPGARVVVDPNIVCGTCRPCRRGQVHLCENLRALGVDLDGGFAELCLVPRAQCYPLPEGVSLVAGAMTEPLACCLHGLDRAGIRAGDTVAVIGGGAIGLMLAQLARLAGAARVVLSDPLPARREMALELGADAALDPGTCEHPLAPGSALSGGADVVIEAVGSAATTAQAIDWAAPGATVLWFGVTPPGDTVAVEPNLVFRKELTILGACINPHTHARALALLASGRVLVAPLITRSVDLEALPELLAGHGPAAGSGDDIKTVVCP